MNILELIFSPAWGGLEILTGVYAKRFSDKGHNITCVFSPNPSLEDEFRSNHVQYKIIKPAFRYVDIFTAWKIKNILTNTKIDIIQVYQSKDLSTAVLLKKLLKPAKLVFTQHMDSTYDKLDPFHKWIYKNIDKVICVTNGMKENHLKHTPIDKNRIEVVFNGVDLNRFNKDINFDRKQFLKEKGIPENKIIIGTIGRLDRLKNQKLLVDAAADLIPKFKEKIHFIIVGNETDSASGKNYKNELRTFIKEKEVDEYFSIFEFSKEVEKYFSILDIFVLTTPKESFGLVLLEAMAMGKPVIASNRGGPPEIIDHGANGFLFNSDNKEELLSQLSKLISDKELRMLMGQKSIDIVKDKFNLDHKVEEYLEIFKKLVQ